MDTHLELYRNGVGRDTSTVNTSCVPMKIILVLRVVGSNVSSFLNSRTFRIKKRTIWCMLLEGLVVSQRRLVWISGSASSLGCADARFVWVDSKDNGRGTGWGGGKMEGG